MITRDRFDLLKRKRSDFSSWAVWRTPQPGEAPKAGIGDLSVLDPDQNPGLLSTLNPDVVFVGLNMSSRFVSADHPWGNFHDPSPRANDFKIRFALEQTRFWGAYMTDVFVDLPETRSPLVKRWMADNPALVSQQLNRFEGELEDLGAADPLLVAFGGAAFDALKAGLNGKRRIVKVMHYAHYISKEKYREHLLETLDTVS